MASWLSAFATLSFPKSPPIPGTSDHRTTKQWICSLVVIQKDMGELLSIGMWVGCYPPGRWGGLLSTGV